MRAGRKDRRIDIQIRSTSTSNTGAKVESWTLYREVWAQVTPMDGREMFSADQITSEVDTEFKIDYIGALKPATFRIKYVGKIYDIRYVAEVGRREAMTVLAKLQGV